jgi:hypothetical protein
MASCPGRRTEDDGVLMSMVTTIGCPSCGHEATETVPTEACVIVYECVGCGLEIRPKKGDCCVFCSYGADPCPTSLQRRRQEPDDTRERS